MYQSLRPGSSGSQVNMFRPNFVPNSPPRAYNNPMYQSLQPSVGQSTVQPIMVTMRVLDQPSIRVVEQPIQVVDVRQYEEMWMRRLAEAQGKPQVEEKVVVQVDNSKIDELQRKIAELQGTVQHQNDTLLQKGNRIRELEQLLDHRNAQLEELESLRSQLQQSQRSNKEKDAEIEKLRRELQALKDRLAGFDQQLSAKDNELRDKQQEIEDLLNEIAGLQDEMSQSSTQTSYLTTEINTWKNKFIELNREFHSTQEAFMLCQAELENLKKGGLKVEKVTTELRSSTQRGTTRLRDSSNERKSNYGSDSK